MLEYVLDLDSDFFLFLNGFHLGWLDTPMFIISETKTWIPLYAFLLFWIVKQLKAKAWMPIVAVILTVVLCDSFTSRLMKPYFGRLRPSHEKALEKQIYMLKDENGNFYKGGQFGFASSHAANSFGLAMFLFLCFRKQWKYAWLLFIWALLVSYSRIYLGVHYPLDIVAGALTGILLAKLIFFFYKASHNKIYTV